jgi:hypothetical protein
VRRLLSMSRSGVIAGLGTILGIAAGFVPAVGLSSPSEGWIR